jgi:hypothetical protein
MKEAFHVGQLVRITRPATGYADHRIYCIVCLISQPEGLPVNGGAKPGHWAAQK